MAGVSVDHKGQCLAAGCTSNDACQQGYFCYKEAGDCDGQGVCTALPSACPDLWDPVCGCDGETHGKALMNRLSSLFGVHLSPGTLYPRLHALQESGLLGVQERVRTKEYSVADGEAVDEFVERNARQHLVLGRLLRDALVVDAEAESRSMSRAE